MNRNQILSIGGLGLFFYILLLAISKAIPSNTAFLCGEFQYSFDYAGLISHIKRNIDFSSPGSLFGCPNCDLIFPYSWYFSLRYFQLLNLGQVSGLNSYVVYLSLSILIQLATLYIFLKVGLQAQKINKLDFIILSILFIFPLYKITLLCSGTPYAISHSIVLLNTTILLFLYSKLEQLKNYKLIIIGGVLNIIGYLSSTYAINFVPILLYSSLYISLLNLKKIIRYPRKIMIVFITTIILVILTNFPWIINIGTFQNEKYYVSPVNNEALLDAITVRYFMYDETGVLAPLFLAFILLSSLFLYLKSTRLGWIIGITYLITVILLLGNNFVVNIYLFVFNNFPLMSTMRASHRLYVFVLILQIIITYYSLSYLSKRSIIRYWIFRISAILICLLLLFNSIVKFKDQIQITTLPSEYEKTKQYFEATNSKRTILYLPYNTIGLSDEYNWAISDEVRINKYIYRNPFQSLYYIENQIQIFNGYNSSPNEFHLEKLKNYYLLYNGSKYIPELETIRNLQLDYVIIDKNSFRLGDVNTSDFENDEIKQVSKFGNLEIYKVQRKDCIPYYGNIISQNGYCFETSIPKYLFHKTAIEYTFNVNADKVGLPVSINRDQNITPREILNEESKKHLLKKGIIYNFNTYEIYNHNRIDYNIAEFNPKVGDDYLLFEGVFIPEVHKNPPALKLKSKDIEYSIPIDNPEKFELKVVALKDFHGQKTEISVNNDFVVITQPIILSSEEFQKLQNTADSKGLIELKWDIKGFYDL